MSIFERLILVFMGSFVVAVMILSWLAPETLR